MADPVLNRPMFQAAASPSAPSAKGVGITSMVTAPNVAAQQLKAIANPMQPAVQGFAEGGSVQHFQEGGPAVASMWDNFVKSLTIKEPDRSGNYRLPDVGLRMGRNDEFRKDAGIMGASSTPNYVEPMDVGGPNAVIGEEQKNRIYRDANFGRMADQQSADPRVAANLEADRISRERQQQARDAGIPQAQRVKDAMRQGAESFPIVPRAITATPDALTQIEMESQREAGRARGLGSLSEAPPQPKGNPPITVDDVTKQPPEKRQPTSDVGLNLQQIKAERQAQSSADRRENALLALMNAGFAMASGKSPHALQNIGAGGQAGIATFAELEKSRRDSENKQLLQDLHERELQLRKRELDIKEPLYAAQTRAQENLPAYREAMTANRQYLAKERAAALALKEFTEARKDFSSDISKRVMADKTGTVEEAIKKQLFDKYLRLEQAQAAVNQYDSANIRTPTVSE